MARAELRLPALRTGHRRAPLGGFGLERGTATQRRTAQARRGAGSIGRGAGRLRSRRGRLRGQSEPGGDPVQSDLRARGRPRHRPRLRRTLAAATVAMPFAELLAQVATRQPGGSRPSPAPERRWQERGRA